uniref:Uncharacterized protein n=1 Tax=Lepeophtheirus salmonis TaxID=72036 RepID=A0A0K2T8J4_LEPSM
MPKGMLEIDEDSSLKS